MSESTKVDPVLITSILDYLRRSVHGYDLAEMAEHFGVAPTRMLSIIEFLWALEFPDTPLSGHEYMFDFDAEGLYADEPWVKLTHDPAARVKRRFDPQELATVLTGLATLREFRSADDIEVLDRLSAKLLGTNVESIDDRHEEHPTIAAMRRSMDRGTQLEISYLAENADAPESRIIDPLRLEVHGAMVYLCAFCHLREGMRWFRHDRIVSHRELTTPIGKYADADRQQPLQVRGKSFPRLQLAVAPSAFAALRPYLDDRDFPPVDIDGYARCSVVFRSLHVAARLAAENPGAVVVEGPDEARAFMVSWATDALERHSEISCPKA